MSAIQVNFDIHKMKPNSVLVMDQNGVVECQSKDEFLSTYINKISELETHIMQLEINDKIFKDKITKEVNDYKSAIYQFIKIQKGENGNEEK